MKYKVTVTYELEIYADSPEEAESLVDCNSMRAIVLNPLTNDRVHPIYEVEEVIS